MNDSETEGALPSWENFPAGFQTKVEEILAERKVPRKGYNYVMGALSAPSRRVRSGAANVSGTYPSSKMGLSIQFESRTLEFAQVIYCEYSEDILGYVAQCPPIKFSYRCSLTNRIKAFMQTPDFLKITRNGFCIVECKSYSELLKWEVERPDYIRRDEMGNWRCPPAEALFKEMGLRYEIVCEKDLPPTRIKNAKMLLDYVRTGGAHGRHAQMDAIQNYVQVHRRTNIESLLDALSGTVIAEDVYRAVAIGIIATDFDESPLVDHQNTCVYPDQNTLKSYRITMTAIARASAWSRASTIELAPGAMLNWNGRPWRLLNLGMGSATLHDGTNVQELDRQLFDRFLREQSITGAEPLPDNFEKKSAASHALLQQASPSALVRALEIYKVILPFQQGTGTNPPNRTERRYLSKWKAAAAAFGNGFVGLLPHFQLSGNRTMRLSKEVMKIVSELTDKYYKTSKKSNKFPVYQRIAAACELAGFMAPSYVWYCGYIKHQPAYEMKLSREGRRAAYGIEPRKISDGSTLSHHADHAFDKGYLDHTELELETRCSRTSVLLGRPWLTTLVDDATGDVLATYLSWDPPSYRSVLMTLRDCVKRHGRLPEEIVCDGGGDMKSVWFEVFAAYFNVTITRRPAARARFGSRGERVFWTIDYSLLHNLLGNTQLRKNVRQLTKEVDPDTHAVWTMAALTEALELFFDRYRNLPHRELLLCPRELRERSMLAGSGRTERRIVYDRNFVISSCPSTKLGHAKVQPDGVKINYLYYNHPRLRRALGKKIPIRFDPMDMSIAFALVDGEWLELISRYACQLKGRTERQLQLAREEYFRHRSQVERVRLTEKTFVTFLQYLDQTEEMLIEHHRANELRRASDGVMVAQEDGAEWEDAESRNIDEAETIVEAATPSMAPGFELEIYEVE